MFGNNKETDKSVGLIFYLFVQDLTAVAPLPEIPKENEK